MTIMVFIHNRQQKRCSMRIDKDSASVGRTPDNDVPIDDPYVSRRHAVIFKTPDGYSIEDLRSENGTWIDGNPIEHGEKVKIESGIPLCIGEVLLSIEKPLSDAFVSTQTSIHPAGSVTGRDGRSVFDDTLMTNRRKLQQIFEISKSLTQSMDLKEVYEKILGSIFLHFKNMEAGAILLRDEGSGALTQVASKVRDSRGNSGLYVSRSIVKQAIEKSKAVMVKDTLGNRDGNFSESIEINRIVSVMCVPLITKTGIRGVIYAYSSNSPQNFGKEDLLFVTSISNPVAVAVENALLFDKSKHSEEELRRVRDHLEAIVQERTSELTKENAKLRELSITDDLTGLFNHRYLVRALELEFIRAIRYNRNLSLLLFDIDNFKHINDNYGHSCGDAVLTKLATLITGCFRSSDVVARRGGDEIAILLPETDQSKATEAAEKLRGSVEKTSFEWHGNAINITCSIGIVTALNNSIADWSDMLDKADQALYRGKGTGKNVVLAFNSNQRNSSAADHMSSPRSRLGGSLRG